MRIVLKDFYFFSSQLSKVHIREFKKKKLFFDVHIVPHIVPTKQDLLIFLFLASSGSNTSIICTFYILPVVNVKQNFHLGIFPFCEL